MTSRVIYDGNLRTTAIHLFSGNSIETDAPTDNQGKGERFSPTDLVATALASCILTTIAIQAPTLNIDGATCEVEKIMVSGPRRIGEIRVRITFPKSGPFNDTEKRRIQAIGNSCPVHQSLHPDCVKTIEYLWPED